MYDWNENDSLKNEYIANKTHWISIGSDEPICGGGNQTLPGTSPQKIGQYGSNLWYTEINGKTWVPNVYDQITIHGPAYIEMVVIPNEEGTNDCYYHITEVFVNKQGWYWGRKNRSLLEIFAGDNNAIVGNETYYGKYFYNDPWVHIKKTDQIQNNEDFVNYCNTRLGEIDPDRGPSTEQQQIAKELLDEFAYKMCGGWVYVGVDSSDNRYRVSRLINPSDTWETCWNWKNTNDGSFGKKYNEVKQRSSTDFSKNLYSVQCAAPAGASLTDVTWEDCGEAGITTFNPKIYHKLNIRYFSDEIRQMLLDVNNFLNSSHQEEMQ